jgi:hypothetical protein
MAQKIWYENKRRGYVWYSRFLKIATALKENKCKHIPSTLQIIYAQINDCKGFNSQTAAWSAHQSMLLVIQDLNLKE